MRLWSARQTSALEAALELARQGRQSALIIEGDAGVGKTALLNELVSRADDFAVVSAEGTEIGATPYATLIQWGVEAADGETGAPIITMPTRSLERRIAELSKTGPVLLRLDDLHWADPESVETLVRLLLRRQPETGVLVAVGTRGLQAGQHETWQRWAAGADRSTRLNLTGLSRADAVELVRHHHPDLGVEAAHRLWQHTLGNPLYLTAVLDEYDAEQLAHMRTPPAPAEFTHVINARVARLTADAVTVLRSAAVLGSGRLSFLDLTAVALVPDPRCATQELIDAALIRPDIDDGPVAVRFGHAMIRAAVYYQTPLPERRLLHARAAEIVRTEMAMLEHRMAASNSYDDDLADAMEDFARRQYDERYFRVAAIHRQWASELTRDPALRERRWLESLFDHAMAGNTAFIRGQLHDLQRSPDEVMRTLVLGTLAVWERRRAEAIRWLSVLVERPDGVDTLTRYRAGILLAWARCGVDDPVETIASGLERARQLGVVDARLKSIEMAASGSIDLRVGGGSEQLAALRRLPSPSQVALEDTDRLAWRGEVMARKGLFSEALADLTESVRRIQDGVTEFGAGAFHALLGYAQWMTGDWPKARANFTLAADLAGPRGHPAIQALSPLSAIGDGRVAVADEGLALAEATLSHDRWFEPRQALMITTVVRAHAYATPDERSRLLRRLSGGLADPRALTLAEPVPCLHAALAAVWAGDIEYADDLAERLATADPQPPWTTAAAGWIRGLVAERLRQPGLATRLLAAAVLSGLDELPLYRAHLLVDHARAASRTGQAEQAAHSRAAASSLYRELGATPYLDRLSTPARQPTGPVPSAERSVPFTSREREVLALVLAGMSYAQIAEALVITERTVGYHLSNIYGKAGVNSRHELTALARSQPRRLGLDAALPDSSAATPQESPGD